MSLGKIFQQFSSFRTQLVVFIISLIALTIMVLYLVNQRSERRIAEQAEKYVQLTGESVQIALKSVSETKSLSDFARGGAFSVESGSIIHHILVVDPITREVVDSTNPDDIKQKIYASDITLPIFQPNDLKKDIGADSNSWNRNIRFSLETEHAKRTVIIVISMTPFYQSIRAGERDRLIAIILLGVLLLLLISSFSKRFTRRWGQPIN